MLQFPRSAFALAAAVSGTIGVVLCGCVWELQTRGTLAAPPPQPQSCQPQWALVVLAVVAGASTTIAICCVCAGVYGASIAVGAGAPKSLAAAAPTHARPNDADAPAQESLAAAAPRVQLECEHRLYAEKQRGSNQYYKRYVCSNCGEVTRIIQQGGRAAADDLSSADLALQRDWLQPSVGCGRRA